MTKVTTNEPTRWEIALTVNGTKYRAVYTEVPTKKCVVATLFGQRERIAAVISAAGIELEGDSEEAPWNGAQKAFVGKSWRFGLTGRTQRDAIVEGELPRLAQI